MNALGLFARLNASLLFWMSADQRAVLITETVRRCIKTGSAQDNLRFLFDLDNRLYSLQGRCAKEVGNGLHLKHEIMRYEEYFVERISASDNVLDVGCGNGRVAYAVASEARARVTAIDLSSEKLKLARELHHHDRIRYIAGDALKELPEGRYDVVILSNVLEHIGPRVEFLRQLKDATGAARYLVRVPIFDRDWRVAAKKKIGIEWRLDPTHEVEYTQESFEEEASSAGFNIISRQICWGEIWAELTPIDNSE